MTIQAIDRVDLLQQAFRIQTVGHRLAARMLGNREVLESQHARGGGHFLECVAAVGGGRMRMEIAFEIRVRSRDGIHHPADSPPGEMLRRQRRLCERQSLVVRGR